MHSFRLYLINAIYILTFPYRFVNIYFCVFSDFFRFRRFFIDISSKALKPPAQNGLPKTELRPPAKPRADSRSAFPQNRAHGVAFAPRRTAGRRTDTRQSVTAANRRSPPLRRIVGPQYAFALRPTPVRKPSVHPTHRRTARCVKPPREENGAIERRSHLGKRNGLCRLSLRHTVITTSPRENRLRRLSREGRIRGGLPSDRKAAAA